MFLKANDWKAIWKFFVGIFCDLQFARTSRINYEKFDEKCYDL